MKKDVIDLKIGIIGAGASGMLLANTLERNNIEYDLFEKKKPGRKLLASGNGRCNISNSRLTDISYPNNEWAYNFVNDNQKELFDLFKELNIYTSVDNEGRMYPISESSQSIYNILMKNIHHLIELDCTEIIKRNGKYYINKEYGPYDKIVVSIGSNASITDKYSYSLLDSIGVDINPFKPSLVGFRVSLKTKEISGVRQKCSISLIKDDRILYQEKGEIIFKDDGISGICIMNASSIYQHLKNKNNVILRLDFLSGNKFNSLDSILKPNLLAFINKYHFNPSNFILPIVDTYDIKNAQVAVGGVDINLLNNNLSYKYDNQIYFSGEVIDADGMCGGFNLMFAFISAIIIFRSIKNEISNK